MGFEYRPVEHGKCQLWRVMNEGGGGIDPRTASDCFANTQRRLRSLEAKILELEASKKAAQDSLRRRHAAQFPTEFRRGARIE